MHRCVYGQEKAGGARENRSENAGGGPRASGRSSGTQPIAASTMLLHHGPAITAPAFMLGQVSALPQVQIEP
jgi:hypothetical protein